MPNNKYKGFTPEEKKAAQRVLFLKRRPHKPIPVMSEDERKTSRQRASRKWYEANKDKLRESSRRWKVANPHKLKEEYHRRREKIDCTNEIARLKSYGMTRDDYTTMLAAQGGVCAICRKSDSRKLAVDHCHTTGFVRGLLCGGCNRGLGQFRDNPNSLVAAAQYLHKSVAEQLDQLLG